MELYCIILASILFFVIWILSFTSFCGRFRTIMIAIAIVLQVLALVIRGIDAQRVPFSSMYETMLLVAGLLGLRLIVGKGGMPEKALQWIIPVILTMNGVIMGIPASMKQIKPLMPALQSFWMMIHVPAYFVGYVSSVLSVIYAGILLIRHRKLNTEQSANLMRFLDQEMKICFFFLVLGITSGAVWAQITWGNYWFWDPKETWALITILCGSQYFFIQPSHFLPIKKAVIAILTFLALIFTYWGVTFLLTGIHSYSS